MYLHCEALLTFDCLTLVFDTGFDFVDHLYSVGDTICGDIDGSGFAAWVVESIDCELGRVTLNTMNAQIHYTLSAELLASRVIPQE